MGLYNAQCISTMSIVYQKISEKPSQNSLPSKFRTRPAFLNCARYSEQDTKLDAYRLQLFQKITHTDLYLRKQFILEMLSCIKRDDTYLKRICHYDKTTFHVCGTVNRHNCHVWGSKNLHGISTLYKTSYTVVKKVLTAPLKFFMYAFDNVMGPCIELKYIVSQDTLCLHQMLVQTYNSSANRCCIVWAHLSS
jgi:hypothetical protein